MGRKKISIQEIQDDRVRRVTFKKRRLGLLKKAMQLSKLTNAKISLKVFNREDNSLVEYCSSDCYELDKISCRQVDEFASFTDDHFSLIEAIEE
jgi:hypothetical protein